MKGFKIYRDYTKWGAKTENSKATKKLFVDFAGHFTWMPSNKEVIRVVVALMKEPNQKDFREALLFAIDEFYNSWVTT